MKPAPTPVLVVVDEGYFGHEAIQDELGPSFAVTFAEGLGGALAALPALDCPLVLAPRALMPHTGDAVLHALDEHRFDFVGLLLVDDEGEASSEGVHAIIRRPLRPGALNQHVRAAATMRQRLLTAVARRRELDEDVERLRDGLRHDLRGHLQSIIGLTSLVLELELPGRPAQDETVEFLRRVLSAGERLTRYVDHVGDWLNQSRKPLERAVVDLGELLVEVVAEVRQVQSRRRLNQAADGLTGLVEPTFTVLTPGVTALGAKVPGDARSLGLALRLLVEHALEQSPQVELALEPTPLGWSLRVRDFSANQLPPSHRARAFKLFERAAGGTGVGLAVVAKVVERHGGSVNLEGHPAGGHIACMCLPAAEPRPLVQPIDDEGLDTW